MAVGQTWGIVREAVASAANRVAPYIIEQPGDIASISRCYQHTRTFSRPMAVIFTRDLLRGHHP